MKLEIISKKGMSKKTFLIIACFAFLATFSGCGDKGKYAIAYRSGAYSSGQDYSQSKNKGGNVMLRGATYTRSGFTQTGWSTAEDGNRKDYLLNGIYVEDKDITLFPFWVENSLVDDTKYTLPTNVKIVYESEAEGEVLVSITAIKIGNNYYWGYMTVEDSVVFYETYLKHNSGIWTSYEKGIDVSETWQETGTYNAAEINDAIKRDFLLFMASEQWYAFKKDGTKMGKQSIADVLTDLYTYTSTECTILLNHDPATNLFFKVTSNLSRYEVTVWDKSIIGFGEIDIPK